MIRDSEKTKLKILLLQIKRRYLFFSSAVDEPLTQKGSKNAGQVSKRLRTKFTNDAKKFGWECEKRANLAVSMHFFPNDDQVPGLHHLVKYYLDLLGGIVFEDDRQVAYLSAQCWRPSKKVQEPLGKNVLYIRVQRLTEYKRKFDIYSELLRLHDFRDYLKGKYDFRLAIDWDEYEDDSDRNNLNQLYGRGVFGNLLDMVDPNERDQLLEFFESERQNRLLGLSKISEYDRPGGPKPKFLGQAIANLRDIEPLSINLGKLPEKGETQKYKLGIRDQLQILKRRSRSLGKIKVPIELDVQVTSETIKPEKDLDNIMLRDIAPVFQSEMLIDKSYLQGYRIYVTNRLTTKDGVGNIRIKLLPGGAINNFEDLMEKTFNAAEEWIEEQLSRYHYW